MALDFQQKKKVRNILYSPIVVGIVVLVAIYFIYSTFAVYKKMVKSRNDVTEAQKSLLTLDQQNSQIDTQVSELQTQAGIEKEIRAKFGVAKPDERMAVIVSDTDDASSTSQPQPSLWDRFHQFFGF